MTHPLVSANGVSLTTYNLNRLSGPLHHGAMGTLGTEYTVQLATLGTEYTVQLGTLGTQCTVQFSTLDMECTVVK